MLLRRVQKLPEGQGWCYEVKWDSYRLQALKDGANVRLLSRNGHWCANARSLAIWKRMQGEA